MDAITILNDAVGGVPVTVTEDFSQIDPTIHQGAVTLKGEQAIHYVRTRRGVGDQLNLSRMERQREYIDSFLSVLRRKVTEDSQFVLDAYDAVSPYMVTDCSAKVISGMMQRYAEFDLVEMVSPEGENVLGETYYEFYVDEESLDKLVLRLFYAPKD